MSVAKQQVDHGLVVAVALSFSCYLSEAFLTEAHGTFGRDTRTGECTHDPPLQYSVVVISCVDVKHGRCTILWSLPL